MLGEQRGANADPGTQPHSHHSYNAKTSAAKALPSSTYPPEAQRAPVWIHCGDGTFSDGALNSGLYSVGS